MAVDIDGVNSTISTDKLIPQSGTALQIGESSDVITIPSGATITNSGTATGFSSGFTYGTEQATTSGSSVTFSSIPTGVSLIHLVFNGVSTDNTAGLSVQLGDSGGIETSGYISTSSRLKDSSPNHGSSTAEFKLDLSLASHLCSGVMTLMRVNASHAWISAFVGKVSTISAQLQGGSKTLSGELTQISITSTGNLDAGSAQILYI